MQSVDTRIPNQYIDGAVEGLKQGKIVGWLARTDGRSEEFSITAVSDSGRFCSVKNSLAKPVVFLSKGYSLECGFEIDMALLYQIEDIFDWPSSKAGCIRIAAKASSGEVVAEANVILSKQGILEDRFRTHLEEVTDCLSGWHADFYADKQYNPVFVLKNDRVETVVAKSILDPIDVKSVFPCAKAWRFKVPLRPSFVVRASQVHLLVSEGDRTIEEIEIKLPPVSYGLNINEKSGLGGWAIDVFNPSRRPNVSIYDNCGNIRTVRATLYRKDLRQSLSFFDGFCGFHFPNVLLCDVNKIDIHGERGFLSIDVTKVE